MQRIGNLRNKLESWDNITKSINDLTELAGDTDENDTEMMNEIETNLAELEQKFESLEFDLLFSGPHDSENAILSVNAGSGGTDAQDWAEMLLTMYLKFAEKHNFSTVILHRADGEEAGIKSATIEIKGDHAFGYLKSEHGVHRLVRISPYDADKARHTSFAMVEVTPEIKEVNYELDEKELRIDTFRSGGHGGQSVNTTDSAVRITHIPTGLTATCQNERSQLQNKEMAMRVLKSKLVAFEEEKKADELAKLKGEKVSAEWGNQIRSYVLQPYTLVKDHRTDYETGDVQKVLNGYIDEFIEAYLRKHA
jgi:peptide chain release factor 2